MIVDVGCRRVQSIRGAACKVVDRRRALTSGPANGGGSRMESARGLIFRVIQLPAEFLDRISGVFCETPTQRPLLFSMKSRMIPPRGVTARLSPLRFAAGSIGVG